MSRDSVKAHAVCGRLAARYRGIVDLMKAVLKRTHTARNADLAVVHFLDRFNAVQVDVDLTRGKVTGSKPGGRWAVYCSSALVRRWWRRIPRFPPACRSHFHNSPLPSQQAGPLSAHPAAS